MATGRDNIIGDQYIDSFLTTYSESFFLDASDYLSTSVATVIPVQAQSGSFVTYPRSYFLRDEMAPRPHGGAPVQVRYSLGKGSYVVDEYGAEHYIDDRDRARSALPGVSLDQNATRLLTTKALVRRDRQWASTFFKPGVWTTDLTGVASGTPSATEFLRWDQAGSDPMRDVMLAADALGKGTGRRPNTLVLGANVLTSLLLSPALVERVKYTMGGILTTAILAQMFGVERVVVARSVYNSAPENGVGPDAENIEYIVDADSAWLGYVERTVGMDAPTAVAMFVWTGLEGGLANAQGGVIRRGRDDRAKSDWFQITDAMQYQALAPDLGVFFSKAIGA